MRGNSTYPVISTGVYPFQCCRLISIGCGNRDRLLTHSTTSPSDSRTKVSTDGFDGLIAVDRRLVRRQVQPAGGGRREPGIAVRRPLHWGAHPVAVTEPDDVAHPDLVAAVQHRGAGQRQQQRGEQLDLVAVVLQ